MTDLMITGLAGDARKVARGDLDALAADLEGTVLYPDDEGFAEATLLWNGMIKKRPAVLIRPETNLDVVRTVNFVREHELQLSIKGGGHNIAGLALSDGGVTLDMSGLKGVDVDAESLRRESARAARSVTSTTPRRSTAWRRRSASSRQRAWRGSRSEAASAT